MYIHLNKLCTYSYCGCIGWAFFADPNAPRSRGNSFAIAFMQNHFRPSSTTAQQIALFITTEQELTRFTIQTRWSGISEGFGFTIDPATGIYSRQEVARNGDFIFVNFPSGRQQPINVGPVDPDIAVQTNGNTDEADRQKGLTITTDNPDHELSIYILNDEVVSTDAAMAINCVNFPNTRDYRYFIFSAGTGGVKEAFNSRFLFTPCEDGTAVTITPSQPLTHPTWVGSSFAATDPASVAQNTAVYSNNFNRFDTLMISNLADLTGTVIVSNRPLSVFSGHQCGTPTAVGTCDYLVEQIPPHPTYGDMFFMAPFAIRESGELYRIGSVQDNVEVTINCECLPRTADGARVAIASAGSGLYTATLNAGQYVECQTPEEAQTYCCVRSSAPVTMVEYTLGNLIDNLANIGPLTFIPIGDPSMVYIPPASNYLNSYSLSTAKNLTTQFQGYLSYILPTNIFDNSPADRQRFRINGATVIPEGGYTAINCRVDGTDQVCAYGANHYLGIGNFDISYDNIGGGAFWGYAYGYAREVSFAYPLAFEMEPTGRE